MIFDIVKTTETLYKVCEKVKSIQANPIIPKVEA